MQIRNDYIGYDGRSYQEKGAQTSREAVKEKKDAASGSMGNARGDSADAAFVTQRGIRRANDAIDYSVDGDSVQISRHTEAAEGTKGRTTGRQTGISVTDFAAKKLADFWNALGEENKENDAETAFTEAESTDAVAAFTETEDTLAVTFPENDSLISTVLTFLKEKVAAPIQSLYERARKAVEKLQRGNNGEDPFRAGADGYSPSGSFTGTKDGQEEEWRRSLSTGDAGQAKGSTSDAFSDADTHRQPVGRILHNSHLTDSYTRNGEYGNLSENVIFNSRRKR